MKSGFLEWPGSLPRPFGVQGQAAMGAAEASPAGPCREEASGLKFIFTPHLRPEKMKGSKITREGDPGSGGDRRRQDPVQCQPIGGREGHPRRAGPRGPRPARASKQAMGAAEAPPAGPRREEEVSSMLVAVCALPAPLPGRGPSSGPNLPTQSRLLQCSIPTGRQHPSCRDKMASDVAYCQPSQLI